MKVAVFISNQPPDTGGGYTFERQLLNALLQLYAQSRHEFVLYVSTRSIPDLLLDTSLPVRSLHLAFLVKLQLKVTILTKAILFKLRHPRSKFIVENLHDRYLLNSLATNQIDLTLSLTPSCPTVEYPYITTVWDLQHRIQPYFPEVSHAGEWDVRENFYAKILRRATFIITGTQTGKAEIEKFYQIPTERIRVIPFFTPQFAATDPAIDRAVSIEYNLPDRYLFYPAQFWSHKNHVNLLLALKYLKEKHDLELPLVLVGADKGNESYIRKTIEDLDLSRQVYLLNFVPVSKMAALYRNAFALIFLTFFGPDNLPPLEAMALGCPVIASNVSGAQEQLGDAAILVNPKQPEEIALAVKSLIEDVQLRQQTIEKGFVRANQWTAKDYMRELLAIVDDFEAIRRCWL